MNTSVREARKKYGKISSLKEKVEANISVIKKLPTDFSEVKLLCFILFFPLMILGKTILLPTLPLVYSSNLTPYLFFPIFNQAIIRYETEINFLELSFCCNKV